MYSPHSGTPLTKRCAACGRIYQYNETHSCPGGPRSDPFAAGSEPSTDPEDPMIGAVLGDRYLMQARLSRGGMGVVYKARHKLLETAVAVKILLEQQGTRVFSVGDSIEKGLGERVGNEFWTAFRLADVRPPMSRKRDLLSLLTRDELLTVVERFDLSVGDRRVKEQILDSVTASHKATLEAVLTELSRDRLKDLCRARGLDDSGREKAKLVERLLDGKPAREPEPEPEPEPPAAPSQRTPRPGRRAAESQGVHAEPAR